MPELSADVLRLRPELIALRRELHQHPELAYAETATAARIAGFLGGGGIALRTGVGGTGVLATVGGGGGRTVLLRVDMDGLPIQEQNDVPYASRVPGRHARLRARRARGDGRGRGPHPRRPQAAPAPCACCSSPPRRARAARRR